MRICIVDADLWILKMDATVLGKEGHEVECANDGLEAMAKLTMGDPFHLVITSVMLPGKNGYDIIRELRELPGYSATPILVAASEMNNVRNQEVAIVAGATQTLGKPYRFEELVLRVRSLLGLSAVPDIDAVILLAESVAAAGHSCQVRIECSGSPHLETRKAVLVRRSPMDKGVVSCIACWQVSELFNQPPEALAAMGVINGNAIPKR